MNRIEAEVKYRLIKISAFRALILKRDEDSEIAAYYLLRHSVMYVMLKQIFRDSQSKEEFDDVLSDFYLYLRDGKDNSNKRIFQSLEGIRSYFAFESWLKKVFTIFVNERLNREIKTREIAIQEAINTHQYDKRKDQEIHFLGQSIASFDANETAVNRFIFYRNLLAKLDRKKVIENEKMAGAMGLSYDNYRQIDSRNKAKLLKLIEGFESGHYPRLSENQKSLSLRIELEFEQLTTIVGELYEAALEILPCKSAIMSLREEDSHSKVDSDDFESEYSHMNVRFRLRETNEDKPSIPAKYLEDIIVDFSDLSPQRQVWESFSEYLHESLTENEAEEY